MAISNSFLTSATAHSQTVGTHKKGRNQNGRQRIQRMGESD